MEVNLKYFAMFVTLCVLALGSASASAGQLKCKHQTLQKSDERRAVAALRREVGALEINGKETAFCRNARNARAWFVTNRVQAADGAFDHVTASCTRGWIRWQCGISKNRTIDFRFDSNSMPGAVTIPQDMTPQFAKSLFRRADSIAREQATAGLSCSVRTKAADDYALHLRDQYVSRDNVEGSEISRDTERRWDGVSLVATGRQIVSVTRGLMQLKFVPELAADGSENLKFDCWEVMIVVG